MLTLLYLLLTPLQLLDVACAYVHELTLMKKYTHKCVHALTPSSVCSVALQALYPALLLLSASSKAALKQQ